MRLFLITIGRIIALLFLPITCRAKRVRRVIYSGYSSAQLKDCGSCVSFEYPVRTIIGSRYISIGQNTSIGRFAVLTAWDKHENETYSPQIHIGENVAIGDDCHITAINRIEIGSNVLMGKKITITDNSHGDTNNDDELGFPPIKRRLYSKGPVVIKNNVWIGDKVTVCAGVTIGENAIVGANAVVVKDVAPNTIVGGVPAVFIKDL